MIHPVPHSLSLQPPLINPPLLINIGMFSYSDNCAYYNYLAYTKVAIICLVPDSSLIQP